MSGITTHLRDSRAAMAGVVRNRSLRRVNLALAGSVIGDWAYTVALSIYAYDRGGPNAVGALAVVRYVSTAILAPMAAILADRFDRRRVMVVSDVIRGLLVAATALLVMSDAPALPVYALSVLTACAGMAFRPAQSSLLPSLATTPSELTAANVTASTVHSVGFFAGPAIAGLLLAVTDVAAVLWFDAATFVWSAVLVASIRVGGGAASTPAGDEPGDVGEGDVGASDVGADDDDAESGGALDGFRTIFASRDLRLLCALYVAQTVVAGASAVYEVAIALDLLGMSDSGLGVLNVALGIGGVLGGLVALVLAQRGKQARDFGLGVVLWAAPLLLVAAFPSVVTALAAMLLIGLGNSVVDVNAETIIQRLVPNDVLGRVFGALDGAAIGGMAVGAAAMPVLISTVGLRSGLVVVGVVVTLVVVVSLRGLARIDTVALAPEGVATLLGVPMLAVLPEHIIERLAGLSAVVDVPGDSNVFHAGDVGDRFYIIERGTAVVIAHGVVVASLGAGDSFGEIALLSDVPRTATVRATSDLHLRAIERDDFLSAVTGHADAADQAELVVGRLMDGA